ncbi:hypothetical protein MRB53_034149 [Persea americana]|uniref:Uncharacterized protein n=1 Tax=Persea americana TaxID=3435 RepID=A0ACC2KXV7_PERAE|nr:hypothetical protein MRB53_034149 [Persea americana]|eukprot:TRINITY_DN26789_c0_g1_i2.p1 TRINITY_DN26789_c0_g1~~TRINITY_DN26789_c0_g1_i2.p1  ORF type:complete len:341 (-),score=71.08 TRINITY_DN26789_c0_g1_i2:273-1295(-)
MNGVRRRAAVLYHYPCPDGAFAALAAHLYFSATSLPAIFFPNTVYDPIRAGNLPLEDVDEVYLLDFAGPSGFVGEISSKVRSVVVLDHHKTALEMLCGDASIGKNVTSIIDMERSGATIAFDYFKEKIFGKGMDLDNHYMGSRGNDVGFGCQLVRESEFARVHRLFKYIEDGDLWRWAVPDSKAFSSGLKDLNIEYSVNLNPTLFEQLMTLDPELVISKGRATLSHKQKLIDDVLEQSYEISLGGGSFGYCLAVDADSILELRSEIGDQLANKSCNSKLRGIGAVVYRVPELKNDEFLKISLRSVENEDTTPISQKYGGGGHRNASSFMLSSADFDRWKT